MADALEYAPGAAVGGDPAALRAFAHKLDGVASTISTQTDALNGEINGTTSYWSGGPGDRYRAKMTEQTQRYAKLRTPILSAVSAAATGLAGRLEQAQQQMSAAIKAADGISGLGAGALLGSIGYGGPGPAVGQGLSSSQNRSYYVKFGYPAQVNQFRADHQVDAGYFQPVVDQATAAFQTAREARRDFVGRLGGAREELARLLYNEPSKTEQQVDAQVADRKTGNEANFVAENAAAHAGNITDPEGRVMAFRYQSSYQNLGVFHHDGSATSEYLAGDPGMQNVVSTMLPEAINKGQLNPDGTVQLDYRGNATLPDNNYGTGLQYLHGTDATVGDFHISGTATPNGDGTYEVHATYTWNDIVDPNPQYLWDRVGSALVPGTAYPMHIEFTRDSTVQFDPASRVTTVIAGYGSGYQQQSDYTRTTPRRPF